MAGIYERPATPGRDNEPLTSPYIKQPNIGDRPDWTGGRARTYDEIVAMLVKSQKQDEINGGGHSGSDHTTSEIRDK